MNFWYWDLLAAPAWLVAEFIRNNPYFLNRKAGTGRRCRSTPASPTGLSLSPRILSGPQSNSYSVLAGRVRFRSQALKTVI